MDSDPRKSKLRAPKQASCLYACKQAVPYGVFLRSAKRSSWTLVN